MSFDVALRNPGGGFDVVLSASAGTQDLQPPLLRGENRFFAPTITQAQILSAPFLRERTRLFPPGPRTATYFTEPSDFNDAYWTLSDLTVSGTAGAPDGQLLTESTDGGATSHRIQRSIEFETTYATVEAEVKPVEGGRDWFRFIQLGTGTPLAFFNARTGEVGNKTAGTHTATQRLEDGWMRVTWVFQPALFETVNIRLDLAETDVTASYVGDGRDALRVREFYMTTGINVLAEIVVGEAPPLDLQPPLLRGENRFFTPTMTTGAVTLSPPLHRDQDRFFAPAVTVGAVTLSPALLRDQDRFFVPTISTGAVTLAPPLTRDGDRFFTQALAVGVVTLAPPLHRDQDRFFAPTVTTGAVSLTAPLTRDQDRFFPHALTQGAVSLQPPFLADQDRFFAPTVTTGVVGLSAPFLRDADRSYALTLSVGAVTLSPPLTRDEDRFFGPTVTRGAVTLAPALFRDADRFFAPALTTGGVSLAPALLRDQDRFFVQTITLGDATLLPPLLRDEDQFFAFAVALEGDDGAALAGSDVGGQTCTDLFVPERPAEIYRVVARTR